MCATHISIAMYSRCVRPSFECATMMNQHRLSAFHIHLSIGMVPKIPAVIGGNAMMYAMIAFAQRGCASIKFSL